MMKKLYLGLGTIAMIFAFNAESLSNQRVNELILQKTTPQKTLFTGEVLRGKSAELSFPKDGRLEYVSPIGTLVKGQLTDKDGKILEKGDLLAVQDPVPYELEVKVSEVRLGIAKTKFNEFKTEHERDLKLSQKNVISQKTLLHSKTLSENAKSSLYEAAQGLDKAKYELDTCYIYAPFRGLVEEVYFDRGTSVGKGKPVLLLSLLSPAKIRIKLSRDIIRKLNLSNTFEVFPAGSKQPLPGWLDRRYVNNDYIEVFVVNKPIGVQQLSKKQEKMPKVHKLLFASNISDYEKQVPLWVPPDTLHEDEKGFYVLRAKDQALGKPVDPEFQIEKIRVKPLDKFMYQGMYRQRALSDPGNLKKHQLLVADSSSPLNDGETAVLQELCWEFNPGEKVWVRIPGIDDPGYYIPAHSVFSTPKGKHYIFAEINGKAEKIDIEIQSEYEDSFKITGKDVTDGLKVILPANGQMITEGKNVETIEKQ